MGNDKPSSAWVLFASALFTGKPGERISDAAVVITDDSIAWAGPSDELPEQYRSYRQEHYDDATILPGLIETHAHLGTEWRSHPEPDISDPQAIDQSWNTLYSLHTAQQLASYGVTTIQSLGSLYYSDVAVREAIQHGLAEGPRIVAAGGIITPTGGHGWRNGAEVDSITDILREVRAHHKAGVDTIKFAGTGGFLTPGSAQWRPQFSLEELRAGVNEAHRLGKVVAVHAHGTAGIEQAVDTGVDLIAHASFVSDDGITRFVPELADRIAAAGIYVDVSAAPGYPLRKEETWFGRAIDLYKHGVKIVAGHDIGIQIVPPSAYLPSLELLHEAGIPAEEVLLSATSRAASAIGLAGIAGVIASGYEADIVVVQGNPFAHFSDIRNLIKVIIRGKDYSAVAAKERLTQTNFAFPEISENRTLRQYQVTLKRQTLKY